MKRIFSTLLAMLMLLSCVAVPTQVFAKNNKLSEVYDLYVFVPDNQVKTLCLTWHEGEGKPDGYQIFRSTSGKKGTYKRIATTIELSYTDTGLKNQTIYYYAVRAFVHKGNKTVYSSFSKRDCFTKITKSYAAKLLKNAYSIYQKWIVRDSLDLDYNKAIKYLEKIRMNDGTIFDPEISYYLVKDKTIKTKKAIEKLLKKYFSEWTIGTFVDDYYVERNGQLYTREPSFIYGEAQDYERFKIRDIAQKDDYLSFSVLETWMTYTGDYQKMAAYSMYRDNKKWLFTDTSWFPTKEWYEREACS